MFGSVRQSISLGSLPSRRHRRGLSAVPARLQSLTILRLVAAVWVMVFHFEMRTDALAGGPFATAARNGMLAMSVFFILSGIVLSHAYRAFPDGTAVRRFYLARFARIYPTYFVVHVLALLWYTPATPGWAIWLYSNTLSALGLQAWFPHVFLESVNSGTWSISVEFFFYALFPALLPALDWSRVRFGTFRPAAVLVILAGLIGLAATVLNGGLTYYISPALRLPEFALGVLIGGHLWSASPPTTRPAAALALAATALAATVAFWPLDPAPGRSMLGNGIVVPLIAAVFYLSVRAEQFWRPAWRSLPARILIYLGEASYSLFLGHLLVIAYLESPAGQSMRGKALTAGHGPELFFLMVLVSFALAFALHELIEKPARRAILRRTPALA